MPARTFDQMLAAYPPEVQTLALRARKLIFDQLPAAEESVDRSGPYVSYGYGSGYSGMICTLILSRSGVKLGLVGGAALDDPQKLLKGGGKRHRYVVLNTVADLRQRGLTKLVQSTVRAWRKSNNTPEHGSNRSKSVGEPRAGAKMRRAKRARAGAPVRVSPSDEGSLGGSRRRSVARQRDRPKAVTAAEGRS